MQAYAHYQEGKHHMPKYIVTYTIQPIIHEVEADNEDEAVELTQEDVLSELSSYKHYDLESTVEEDEEE